MYPTIVGLPPVPEEACTRTQLLARDGQQAERVVLAQVGLLGERQPREVVERADRLGRVDARVAQPVAQRRRAAEEAADQIPEALELERPRVDLRRAATGARHVALDVAAGTSGSRAHRNARFRAGRHYHRTASAGRTVRRAANRAPLTWPRATWMTSERPARGAEDCAATCTLVATAPRGRRTGTTW